MKTIDQQIKPLVKEWTALVKELKGQISDDYRASEFDDEDGPPSMCLTIGFTLETPDNDASWSYQTGDNSFSGGAYGHRHWAVVTLTRRCNSKAIAAEIADEIAEACAYDYEQLTAKQTAV